MGIDGANKPNNMEFLLDFIKPNVGIMLNVSSVHAQQFADDLALHEQSGDILSHIAKEKGKLVTTLTGNNAYAILTDDPYIQALKPHIAVKNMTVGQSAGCDFKLESYGNANLASSFSFRFNDIRYEVNIQQYFISKAHTSTLLAVIATAHTLGVPISESITALEETNLFPPGRASIFEGIHHSIILDSSYNSSPIALRAMLESISQYTEKKRVILVLGDMRELGPLSKSEHESLAPLVLKTSSRVILVGPQMGAYLYPLLKDDIPVKHFINTFQAAQYSKESIKTDDIVIVKGSQNTIFLEIVVKSIVANPLSSSELLCRQSREWDAIRANYFSS
jgi:UDP-N-acetylmuramoyl-tripeptide--D-alanyl-D-alanine ligase